MFKKYPLVGLEPGKWGVESMGPTIGICKCVCYIDILYLNIIYF
jgi:hypothetical protein